MWEKSAQYNNDMWNQTAGWNEMMMNRQMEFNSEEAEKNREWQKMMESTKYQRAVEDLKAAGINPIVAAGGISAGAGSGSAASVGGTNMSPMTMSGAQGTAASGGLVNANSASEGSYSGQMEYMGGMLGLLSAGIAGISSALSAFGGLGNIGADIGDALRDVFSKNNMKNGLESAKDFFTDRKKYMNKYGDSDNGFNRYYNPTSKYWIGNKQ